MVLEAAPVDGCWFLADDIVVEEEGAIEGGAIENEGAIQDGGAVEEGGDGVIV